MSALLMVQNGECRSGVCMCLSPRLHVSISALACVYLRVGMCLSQRLQETTLVCMCLSQRLQKHKSSHVAAADGSIGPYYRVYMQQYTEKLRRPFVEGGRHG